MEESYSDKLKSELRRADHLLYVSLKYTRTVDVLRSLLHRLMNAYEVSFDGLLHKVKRRRKTLEIPEQPRKKCEVIRDVFSDEDKMIKAADFYIHMRDIYQAKYDKREEYRRHVTMISHLKPGQDVEVNIDLMQEYYNNTKKFEEYVLEKIE